MSPPLRHPFFMCAACIDVCCGIPRAGWKHDGRGRVISCQMLPSKFAHAPLPSPVSRGNERGRRAKCHLCTQPQLQSDRASCAPEGMGPRGAPPFVFAQNAVRAVPTSTRVLDKHLQDALLFRSGTQITPRIWINEVACLISRPVLCSTKRDRAGGVCDRERASVQHYALGTEGKSIARRTLKIEWNLRRCPDLQSLCTCR